MLTGRVGMLLTMSPDDPGVMGNLPRSRPGRRSSKRDSTRTAKDGAAEPTAAKASASSKPKAAKTTSAKSTSARRPAKRTSAGSGATGASRPRARAAASSAQAKPAAEQQRRPAPRGGTDPVTGAVMLAGKVVDTGLKVAGGILKRLPKP